MIKIPRYDKKEIGWFDEPKRHSEAAKKGWSKKKQAEISRRLKIIQDALEKKHAEEYSSAAKDIELYLPPGIPKITKEDLMTTGQSGYKRNIRRMINSSPDKLQNAKLTFLYENNLHKKYPDLVDWLGVDCTSAPKVDVLPPIGLKGQVVEYKGKLFIAGSEIDGLHGIFKTSQKTIGDYAKGKSRK